MTAGLLGRLVRVTGIALALTLALGVAPLLPLAAYAETLEPPDVKAPQEEPAEVSEAETEPRPDNRVRELAGKPLPQVSWPQAASASVDLGSGKKSAAQAGQGNESSGSLGTRAGKLPVWVSSAGASAKPRAEAGAGKAPPERVRVRVLSRAMTERAGVDGVLVRLARTDGAQGAAPVRMRLDYSSFAGAYGANYGSRLRLYRLPQCALTTPGNDGCGLQPVNEQRNDATEQTVTARVEATAGNDQTESETSTAPGTARFAASSGGAVYALAAEESGSQGDYSATKLSPSATWKVSRHSGSFAWSYPMRTPPVPGGLTPKLRLSYSSNAVDGRTAVTNNQPSWVGEGFSMWGGYIERSYKPCADDGHGDQSGDLCWGGENAYMVLHGQATKLVKDDDTGEWYLKNDDGSRVEHITGGSTNNGDNNQERWRVTTPDGTQYYFGRHRLPGWSSGDEVTNSTWTVPVFGDDAGEPCHGSDFGGSWCQQAWKWNLDYVKDPNGNVVSYFYDKEWNRYARDGDTTRNGTPYVRGGYLTRIDYGERASQVYGGKSPARVKFTVAERCLPDQDAGITCAPGELDDSTAEHWPDVPYDMHCTAGTECEVSQSAPSFWTRKRLTEVTTQVLQGGSYSSVDSWKLEHLLPDSGDNSRALWLASIDHTGHVGGTKSLPKVTFDGIQKPNRVDEQGDDIPPLIRLRVSQISNETGGTVDINYAETQCTPSDLPAPGTNTKRCFPQYWTPEGEADPIQDWFHKYVVGKVIQTDRTGGLPDQVTDYVYNGGAAWAYDDTEGLAKADERTWSQWRGYRHVRVLSGPDQAPESRVDYTFLRGMHGDKKPGGGTRSVSVTDSTGTSHTDHEAAVGFQMEKIVRDGPSGDVVSKTITTPWKHKTATRSRSWGTSKAFLTGTRAERELTALESGGWRTTRKVFDHETTAGLVTQVNDLGDTSTPADDRCTRKRYAKNTQQWLIEYLKREETVSVDCATTPERSTQVVSDKRTFYDDQGFGVAPTTGDVTEKQEIEAHDGQSATYVTTEEKTYDDYGRVLTSTDAEGNTTTTEYTDTDGLQTQKTVTNPLGHTATTEYAVAWGKPRAEMDANGRRTDLAYDSLGRLTKVWLPNRPKAQDASPNKKFDYLVRKDKAVAVETKTLDADLNYETSYEIFDGFLRPRQTQKPGPEGGRLVTDTFHNARGEVAKENEEYYATGAPSDTLLDVVNGDVNGQVLREYDGAGREVAKIRAVAGQEKWRTTTSYGGDRKHVDPPAGDTPTTVIEDARGNRDELRQYHGSDPSGDFDATTYEHDAADRLTGVTGPEGNTWSYEYDLRGRKVRIDDPDSGVTTKEYDDLGQVVAETDARGKTVAYAYDALERKTGKFAGSTSGRKLAEWEYDTDHKGQLYRETRIHDGDEYSTYYTVRDRLYRPKEVVYHVPSSEGPLGGYYTFTRAYNPDGTLQSRGMPAAGGLAAEGLTYSYDEVQRPVGLSGTRDYVTNTEYSYTGQALQYELSGSAGKTWLTYEYEHGTQRLTRSHVQRAGEEKPDRDASYSYDPAGNVTKIADTGGGASDVQCFDHDYLRRLTESWTPQSGDCSTAPDRAVMGGPAPYWNSYSYDAAGNRTSEMRHGLGGAEDTTRTYTYPGHGNARPHAASGIDQSGPGGDESLAYAYDAAGNTTSRDVPGGGSQSLSWNVEGNLASVSQGGQRTSFVYDVEGERLIRRGPQATVLYLPGMELRLDQASGEVTGKRYYTINDQTVAVRVAGEGLSFLAPDHHGTNTVAVDASSGEVAVRRQTPFGTLRGSAPSWWPDDKGFVGGTKDSTGLTHLGAREYNPDTGRFISVDPVIDTDDPQQMHGYAYANNSPVAFTDPNGRKFCNTRGQCTNPWRQNDSISRDGGGGGGDASGRGPGIGIGDFYEDNTNIPDAYGGGGSSAGGSSGGGGSGGSGASSAVDRDNSPNAYERSQQRAEAEQEQAWYEKAANWARDAGEHFQNHWKKYAAGGAFAACVFFSAGACLAAGGAFAAANYAANARKYGPASREALGQLGLDAALIGGSWRLGVQISRGFRVGKTRVSPVKSPGQGKHLARPKRTYVGDVAFNATLKALPQTPGLYLNTAHDTAEWFH